MTNSNKTTKKTINTERVIILATLLLVFGGVRELRNERSCRILELDQPLRGARELRNERNCRILALDRRFRRNALTKKGKTDRNKY